MKDNYSLKTVLYSDKLIEISESSIFLRNYYFPTMSGKLIFFEDIERIEVVEPTIVTGKYRYWGSGDFQSWFQYDGFRSRREKIFFIYIKDKKIRPGFTVERTAEVIKILSEKIQLLSK